MIPKGFLTCINPTITASCQSKATSQCLFVSHLLPVVLTSAEDSVANVRFNVAKTLEKIGPVLDMSTIQTQFKPVLEKLKTDSDADVRFFSTQAMEVLQLA